MAYDACIRVHWIAPTEKDALSETLDKRLWDAVDQFRANSGRKPLRLHQLKPERQIQNLRRTRDRLLPRLLSGQAELGPSNSKDTDL